MFFQQADPARGIALDHEFLVIGLRVAVHLSVAEHAVDGAQQLVGGGHRGALVAAAHGQCLVVAVELAIPGARGPVPDTVHDFASVHGVRAWNRFRVTFETNRYSVPAEYASRHLTLKAHLEHICIYREERLVARHPRSYDRHRDFEIPDHPKAYRKRYADPTFLSVSQ